MIALFSFELRHNRSSRGSWDPTDRKAKEQGGGKH